MASQLRWKITKMMEAFEKAAGRPFPLSGRVEIIGASHWAGKSGQLFGLDEQGREGWFDVALDEIEGETCRNGIVAIDASCQLKVPEGTLEMGCPVGGECHGSNCVGCGWCRHSEAEGGGYMIISDPVEQQKERLKEVQEGKALSARLDATMAIPPELDIETNEIVGFYKLVGQREDGSPETRVPVCSDATLAALNGVLSGPPSTPAQREKWPQVVEDTSTMADPKVTAKVVDEAFCLAFATEADARICKVVVCVVVCVVARWRRSARIPTELNFANCLGSCSQTLCLT